MQNDNEIRVEITRQPETAICTQEELDTLSEIVEELFYDIRIEVLKFDAYVEKIETDDKDFRYFAYCKENMALQFQMQSRINKHLMMFK